MKTPRFNIGETVLVASFEGCQKWAECPECNGDKFVTVKAGRNDPVTLDCESCKTSPYEGPLGVIPYSASVGRVEEVTIRGIEVDGTDVEYRAGNRIYKQERLFNMNERDAAIKECTRLADEATAQEAQRILYKVKPNRTWAWNASYHRKEIKRCNEQIIYHTGALAVAKRKVEDGN